MRLPSVTDRPVSSRKVLSMGSIPPGLSAMPGAAKVQTGKRKRVRKKSPRQGTLFGFERVFPATVNSPEASRRYTCRIYQELTGSQGGRKAPCALKDICLPEQAPFP